MTEIFKLSDSKKQVQKQNLLSLTVIRPNQVRYDKRSLRDLCPKSWNNLLAHVKLAPNLLSFKGLIKPLNGVSCKFTLCKKL